MADYTVTWAEIPLEQYWALPEQAQQDINTRVSELLLDPTSDLRNYDPGTDHWTVDYGGGAGLIVYAAVPDRRRIIILRLIHLS